MSAINRDPGMYDSGGAAAALIEQQRAEILTALRDSSAHSVTVMEADGSYVHNAIYTRDDEQPFAFIAYAAAKALRDLAALMGDDHRAAAGVITELLDRGIE